MNDPHLRYFEYAKQVAKKSNFRKPVGCCIVRKGTPIALGCNKKRYSKKWVGKWGCTVHAECNALMKIGDKARKSIAYVFRMKKDGKIGMAKPCPDCMKKLQDFGISRVYYTIEEYPYYQVEDL